MKLKIFQIDTFTRALFTGNAAAVCPLEMWLEDSVLQSIAAENNLSETAFFVKKNDYYDLRWFTPIKEVDLCGHATLASAFVIFSVLGTPHDEIRFATRSGRLNVKRDNDLIVMDFPAQPSRVCDLPEEMCQGLGKKPAEILCAEDYLVVFDKEEDVKKLEPDFTLLKRLPLRGVIVTSLSDTVDFVSRFFAPKLGINEDPVTGSAYCMLAPYWAYRLGKSQLHALQLSKRGGEIFCVHNENRVVISGHAVKFMEGEFYV